MTEGASSQCAFKGLLSVGVGFCLSPDDKKNWGLKEKLGQVLIGDNLVYFKGYTKGQRHIDAR